MTKLSCFGHLHDGLVIFGNHVQSAAHVRGLRRVRVERIPIVGVMGSGTEPHEDRAAPLGGWLAEQGVHLLTGGGDGVMEAVSRAFCSVSDRRGHTIGVLPGSPENHTARAGYPNRFVEIPIFTHLPLSGAEGTAPESRNHINILSSDVIVALPGSLGTASEVQLALQYGRPIVAFVDDQNTIPDLPEAVPAYSDFASVRRFVETALEASR